MLCVPLDWQFSPHQIYLPELKGLATNYYVTKVG